MLSSGWDCIRNCVFCRTSSWASRLLGLIMWLSLKINFKQNLFFLFTIQAVESKKKKIIVSVNMSDEMELA